MKNKYKDRAPEDTLSILKKFFSFYNYEIKEEILQTVIGTWSVHLELFYNDLFILHSNGKGETKNLALASGYGELYERFCSKSNITLNPILYEKYVLNNFKKNNFYLIKEEKELSLEELYNIPIYANYLNAISENKQDISNYLDLIIGNKIIGVPYQNFLTGEIQYFCDSLTYRVNRTTGIAAGNTLEEALVQGFSEYCERSVASKIYSEQNQKYYQINLNSISKNNKKLIKKIQEDNNKVFIFDFSYSFNLPVCGLLIVNTKTNLIYLSLGAFPIFDIALERCITEIYQNVYSFTNFDKRCSNNFLIEKDHKNFENYKFTSGNKYNFSIPETLILNSSHKDSYNKNFYFNFKETKVNNQILLNWFFNLFKNNNLNPYIRDISMAKDLYAIHIIEPNLILQDNLYFTFDRLSLQEKQTYLNFLKIEKNIIQTIINLNSTNKVFLTDQFEKIIKLFNGFNFSKDNENFIDMTLCSSWFRPYLFKGNIFEDFILTLLFLGEIDYDCFISDLKEYDKYIYPTLLKLKNNNLLTNNEILKIGKIFLNDLDKNFIENLENINQILSYFIFNDCFLSYNKEYHTLNLLENHLFG